MGAALLATAIAVVMTMATTTTKALAADALLPSRTLFETERFTPGAVRGPLPGGVLPENLVAVRGEFESFQLVVQNATTANLALDARITGLPGGAISADFLRVGMVNVPAGSSFFNTQPGTYADPLPPIRPEGGAAGLLNVPSGQWGGVLVVVKVRTDAPVGDFAGNVELFTAGDEKSQAPETVYARQPYTLAVRNASGRALMQNTEAGAFTTTFGVEGEQYWLGNNAMRNGRDKGFPARPNRMAQLRGLASFLDEHSITPLEMSFGGASTSGAYDCSYDSTKGELPAVTFLDQLKNGYFAGARAIDPGASQHVARWFPYRSAGCRPDDSSDDLTAVTDPKHTATLKQDDHMDPRDPAYWKNVNATWSANGLYTGRTYVKNPFDEPSDATAAQRVQMDIELPKANIALHKAVGKRAKVVLAGWPRDERKANACRILKSKKSCIKYEHELYGNRKLWDGKGQDDVDVWMVPFSRLFGRITQPHLKTLFKINRDREYTDRLAYIRKLKKTETWAYSFYTADQHTPQTVIDGPGTDPRLQYLLLAREGHTGLFISNLLMGWGVDNPTPHEGSSLLKKGDPYQQALYFKHPNYGYAAGWGTFIYPGYAPQLGLTSEDARNTAAGRPVSSLRIEAMRDGQEDANLAIMYRNRFGQAKLNTVLTTLFPNKPYVTQNKKLGQVVFPQYDNGNNLAQRMETVRRQMITELAS